MVVEDENWLHVVKLISLGQLGLELTDVLKELRPLSLRAQLDKVVPIPRTQWQADSTIHRCVEPLLGPCM